MQNALPRVAARLFNAPLMVLPETAAAIAANLADRFGVEPIVAAAPPPAPPRKGGEGSAAPKAGAWSDDDRENDAEDAPYALADGIATIAVHGELINRGSWLDAYSGLTSYERLGKALRQAEADPNARAVILDVDSPGGEAAGAMETAAIVRAVSKVKPVKAFVNSTGASAAYAIAAAASELIVTPSAIVGSIGVVCLHMDRSEMLAEAGVKPTLIHAGAYKVDGNSLQPLGAGAKSRIQAQIDAVYDLFVESVGRHRPDLGEAGARKTEAGVFMGALAVEAGLADRVDTMDGVRRSLTRSRNSVFGGKQMTTENPAAFSQADLDAAVARASTAARAEGVEEGRKAGAEAERARVKAILGCDEAKGRETSAQHLALSTGMSLEDAQGVLAGLVVAAPAAPGRMAGVPRPAVRPDAPALSGPEAERAASEELWAGVAKKLNAGLPAGVRGR
jgi:signal peptide peptidase SppA